MKVVRATLTALALTLAGGAAFVALAGAESLALGDALPKADQRMQNVDGKSLTLAQAKGEKGTLVVFTCNGCPWVKRWEGRMVELGNRFVKDGVGVVFVNSNDPSVAEVDGFETMKARSRELQMSFPYVVDATSGLARTFGATRTPEAFLFDAKGRLVYHGTIDDNAQKPEEVTNAYLADALGALVAGKEVPVAETKALGCGIKFRSADQGASASQPKKES